MTPSWRATRVITALLVMLSLAVGMLGPDVAAATPQDTSGSQTIARMAGLCGDDSPLGIEATARELLANRYHFGAHHVATLQWPLTWREDPFGDRQWRQKLQMLRYTNALIDTWKATGQYRYKVRAVALIRSWLAANPYRHAASPSAWADQVTAWRTMTLVCVASQLPTAQWIRQAIAAHGAVLAQPSFWVGRGNHALNQAIALLDAGCYLGRRDWLGVAADRIGRLVRQEVDTQGVADEQATGYVRYDYQRFSVAATLLLACGASLPPGFGRIGRMPQFLAQATRPDGLLETIGDTDDEPPLIVPGTPLAYAASQGTQGTPPTSSATIYRAGYAFARTGWGTTRPFADETFLSVRFGRGLRLHGHNDAGSVTLYGAGGQLLADPGYGDQNGSLWHRFFVSRAAHNVVTVDGLRSDPGQGARLVYQRISPRAMVLKMRIQSYPGVTMTRRVIFSRRMGYAVVEDTMAAVSSHTYRQLWHLIEDARPITEGRRTWTRRPDGNVLIQQLTGGSTSSVSGRKWPLQGWISRSYGAHAAAPVIMRTATGTSVRMITLLVPFGQLDPTRQPPVQVRSKVTGAGFRVRVEVDGQQEQVRSTNGRVSISDVP